MSEKKKHYILIDNEVLFNASSLSATELFVLGGIKASTEHSKCFCGTVDSFISFYALICDKQKVVEAFEHWHFLNLISVTDGYKGSYLISLGSKYYHIH